TIVQQHGIGAVPKGKTHSAGNKHVVPTIGVHIANADAPGPVRFNANLVGNFLELSSAKIVIERVPKDEVASGAAKDTFRRRFGDRHFFLFLLGWDFSA